MNHYPILPIKKITPWIDEMHRLNVSKIARGPDGILTYYLTHNELNEHFIKKRNSFLARTLGSFYKNPTYRRFLSIIAWAYMPEITNQQLKEILGNSPTNK